MENLLYIFLSGIALTTGTNYLWLGVIKKRSFTDVLFGLFASAAGVYYLLTSLEGVPGLVILFFATIMFVLFPWYFAYESGFIKRKLLWVITFLGFGYYFWSAFSEYTEIPQLALVFSYGVYVLSAIYALGSTHNLRLLKKEPVGPFIAVTIYYIVCILEEIAYNAFGLSLPWRRIINFYYLDFFPVVLISFKIFLMAYSQLQKTRLEGSIAIYQNNLNVILNQAERYVLTLDVKGEILFANPFFINAVSPKTKIKHANFLDLLSEADRGLFQDKVLDAEGFTGKVIASHNGADHPITVSWSFVKLKDDAARNIMHITLFGADISDQKETELSLIQAYEELEVMKNKLEAENLQLRNESSFQGSRGRLVGASPNFNYVLNRIEDVAPLDVPVLLEGETGVGKELFASAIHEKSNRSTKPYIKVNCSAIPENLLESELFGFEKGAFTGADKLKRGMFELADGGTLFLDEIGDLPMSLQPKLLRALQEGEIKRLGAEKTMKVDIRLIAATNLSLQKQVEIGEFRSDLFYRLNVFPITIPPLRKRKSDIPRLINSFIKTFNEKYDKQITEISGSLMKDLTDYSWPGNIRQLRNIIERAVITTSGSILKLADPLPFTEKEDSRPAKDKSGPKSLGTLEDFERGHITRVLEYCDWRISGKKGAAEILNLPASTLRSKMKKLGITSPAKS